MPAVEMQMEEMDSEKDIMLEIEAGDAGLPGGRAHSSVWPLRVGVALLVTACVGIAVATANRTGAPQQTQITRQDESSMLQAASAVHAPSIDLTKECDAALDVVQKKANDAFEGLPEKDKNVFETKVDGPEIKIICKAKTFLILDVKEVQGMNSGSLSVDCNDASATVTAKADLNVSAAISFSDSLAFTIKIKEKGTFCHIPKSTEQTVTMTISGLSISTDVGITASQGLHTKITSAALSDFMIKYHSFKFDCDGDDCDSSPRWMVAINHAISGKLSSVIENGVNAALADEMPITLP